ncbi:MAG: hypothetical protein U5L01_03040 [Rheinheimera sp.]|nr:hypothetical protein [Rheinheimera sp.]
MNNKMANSVRIALAFGAVSTAAFTANSAVAAEEEAAEKVERMEVTGSRIKRADMEGANPVTVLDKIDIERFGLTSIGDVCKIYHQQAQLLTLIAIMAAMAQPR